MKYVRLQDLDVDSLNKLIERGERFYVLPSDILSENITDVERDAFWSDRDEPSETV